MKKVYFLGFIFIATMGWAAPNTIHFQGRLTDTIGSPISNSNPSVEFEIYDSLSGGTLVWQAPSRSTVTTNGAGLFSTDIGPVPVNIFSANNNLYLQIYVYNFGVRVKLDPRQAFSIVPYAFSAEFAATAGTATMVMDDSITSAKIQDGAITSVDLATDSVNAINIVNGAVLDQKIFDVSATKITGQINDSQIQSVDIQKIMNITGIVVPYAGTAAPPGWLMCDGSIVSISQYSALYSVIGTSFGQGNGTTTFNLPDLRGRFIRGVDNGTMRDPDRLSRTNMAHGGNVGDSVGSIQGDEVKPHSHSITDPGHSHSLVVPGSAGVVAVTKGGSSTGVSGGGYNGGSFEATATVSATTGVQVNVSTGQETRPINVYLNYIIKY